MQRYHVDMSDTNDVSDMVKYTITDGKLVLDIYDAEEGGFFVQGTFDRALLTQGETLKEVFEMAHDAADFLAVSRRNEHDRRERSEPAALATA